MLVLWLLHTKEGLGIFSSLSHLQPTQHLIILSPRAQVRKTFLLLRLALHTSLQKTPSCCITAPSQQFGSTILSVYLYNILLHWFRNWDIREIYRWLLSVIPGQIKNIPKCDHVLWCQNKELNKCEMVIYKQHGFTVRTLCWIHLLNTTDILTVTTHLE